MKSIMLLFHKKTENHEAEEAGLRLSKRIPFTLSKALYLALLFVLLIILMLSIYSFFNPDMHYYQLDMSFKGLAIVLLLLFLISIYLVVRRVCNVEARLTTNDTKDKTERGKTALLISGNFSSNDMLLLFLIAFSIRLCFLLFYGNSIPPFSDFGWAHETALGSPPHSRIELFPSWAFFSLILRFLYQYTIPHFLSAQLLNAVATSVTTALIYVLAYRIGKNRDIALVAATIFAFYPANIIYNAILTPEHLAIFLSSIILLLLSNKQKSTTKHYINCGIAGIACAFMDYLKPIAMIIIIAYMIALILNNFINNTSRRAYKVFLPVLFLLFPYFVSSFAIGLCTESALGIKFADSSNTRAHFLYVGLQPSGEGQIHLGDNPTMYYYFLEQTDGDYSRAKEMTYDYLWKKIEESTKQFALLFPQKFRWAWQDDTVPSYYVWEEVHRNADTTAPRLLRISYEILPTISQLFYISLIALSAYGLVSILKKRFNFLLFMISLYCSGFIFLLLIIEAQSRYKCKIILFLCILAAYGAKSLFKRINKKSQTIQSDASAN